ncbi:MAG: glutathione S-transferase [Gammaproteobacteria bacterium]|nr:glutathione S-transferase [Gammaproteobacteria bacterium]
MHELKLSYFDFHGGRGEVARLAMSLGNIDFEDHRIPLKEWPSAKASTPLGAVPVLEVDGEAITQSNGINRFVGKLSKLYPNEPLDALRCDEVMGAVEDVLVRIVPTFFIQDEDEKKQARQKLVEGPISRYLAWLEDLLRRRGNRYFVAGRLTVADLKVFVWIRSLRKGTLDYVAADLVDHCAPNLVAHSQRIEGDPAVKAYYEARSA